MVLASCVCEYCRRPSGRVVWGMFTTIGIRCSRRLSERPTGLTRTLLEAAKSHSRLSLGVFSRFHKMCQKWNVSNWPQRVLLRLLNSLFNAALTRRNMRCGRCFRLSTRFRPGRSADTHRRTRRRYAGASEMSCGRQLEPSVGRSIATVPLRVGSKAAGWPAWTGRRNCIGSPDLLCKCSSGGILCVASAVGCC